MSLTGIGRAQRVLATHRVDVLDDHVAIGLAGLAMILHVDGIDRSFGVHLAHGDVVGAVADFHGAPQAAVVTTHVVDQHVSDPAALAATTADGDGVAHDA